MPGLLRLLQHDAGRGRGGRDLANRLLEQRGKMRAQIGMNGNRHGERGEKAGL